MKQIILTALMASSLMASSFTLQSNDLEGQLNKKQEFNGFGCTGKNMSPELHWKDAPKGTKSFAITVYDPDASAQSKLPKGAVETMTDYGSASFGGACPPKGDKDHAYVFTVYALDVEKLDVNAKSDSALVGYMINQHVLEKATMVSYYGRDK